MTSLSSSSRSRRSQTVVLFLAAAVTLVVGACEDRHIGRPCDLNLSAGMSIDPRTITINAQALECPSRLCILPAQDKNTPTGPTCSDFCSSDDDCSESEKSSSASDGRCMLGFSCRYVLPNLSTNALHCKRACMCKDFFLLDDVDVKPTGC